MPCAICLDDSASHPGGHSLLECRHAFGATCIARWCRAQARLAAPPCCPVCRRRVSAVDAVRIAANEAMGASVLHCLVAEEGGDAGRPWTRSADSD